MSARLRPGTGYGTTIYYRSNDPVEVGLVDKPQDYLYSIAVDYPSGKPSESFIN